MTMMVFTQQHARVHNESGIASTASYMSAMRYKTQTTRLQLWIDQ